MKKLAIILATVTALAAMCTAMSITAFAGEWGSQDGRWYYLGDGGKYYTNGLKSIDGKTYAFDYDGWMITGFTDSSLNPINGTDVNAAMESTYYFGTDGAMHTGWLKVAPDNAPSEYEDYTEFWFYYGTNGRKVCNESGGDFKIVTIDGTRYVFDYYGVMVQGWGTSSSGKSIYVDNGQLAVGWKQLVPPNWMNSSDNEAGTKRWFYFKNNGEAVKDGCRKVNSAYYLFDSYGILKTGLYRIDENIGLTESKYSDFIGTSSSSEENWEFIIKHTHTGKNVYYFTVNGMQKGTQTFTYDDAKRTFYFESNGKGANGIKSGKLYVNGGLVTSGDDSYAAAYSNLKDDNNEYKEYIVNKSGTRMNKGSIAHVDDCYWAVAKNGYIGYFQTETRSDVQTWVNSNPTESRGIQSYIN